MTAKNTPNPKKRQPKNTELVPVESLHSQPVSVVPLIVEHGLYSREQIIAALAISPTTLDKWIRLNETPLRVGQRGTKRIFFRGRDVMGFLVGES